MKAVVLRKKDVLASVGANGEQECEGAMDIGLWIGRRTRTLNDKIKDKEEGLGFD